MSPFFSIITVSYNSVKTIAQTIESVLNQPFADFEYLIIDGGSTDGTVELVKSYQPKFGKKLIFVSENDNGIYDAMNKGLKLAKGELVGIINSDDWYDDSTLQRVYEESCKHKQAGVYYGLLMNYRGDKVFRATGYHHDFLNESIISHPTCFISKSIYEKFGQFDLQYRLAADYDLILRLYKNGVNFYFISQILAHFREGGSTDVHKNKSRRETYLIYYRHGLITRKKYIKNLCSLKAQYLFRKWVINVIKKVLHV